MVLQMEAVECGAAALAIILGYYRRIVPLAVLRRECGVSRDGSKCSNVCKAARNYGLVAKAFKKDLPGLKALRYPYIVFWNFNHFLVVEGYRNGRVYLNDPASGPRSVDLEEFDESYTGVVMVMEPGPEFRPGGRKKSMLGSIRERLRGSSRPLLFSALTALLLVLPGLATPALTQTFVDKVLVQGFRDWGRPLVLGMILAALLKAFLTSIELRVLRFMQIKLAVSMAGRFVWQLFRLPAAFYAQRYAGEISSRIALNDNVAGVLSGRLATTAIDVLMMVFYLAVMLQFNVRLSLVAAAFAALNFATLRWIARRRVEGNYRLAANLGKTVGFGIAGLQSIRTLKASGLESDFYARWAGYFANLGISQTELGQTNNVLGVLPGFLTSLMTACILVFGGFEVMRGQLSIGQLVAFQSLTTSFLLPVISLVSLGETLQVLEGELNRLDDVLSNPVAPEPEPGEDAARMSVRLQGRLEFHNVSFGYSPVVPPLIEGLSFTLEPGQRIALVGGSGSGKSTIAKLVAGLYLPTGGEILFDGVPASRISREVMAHSLAMVEQDILLFGGTVRDNLTLWDSSTPEASVVQACEDAMVDDVIRALPEGYRSSLLEGAANLSGGQRQRLEIARALASNPSLLIMDEATSALDAETERLIDRNIRRRGCSCVIVAHRLSTIRDCDEIVVLDQGKVVQRGTHAEMVREGGHYLRLLADDSSAQAHAGEESAA
ncbi:MAG: NHLP family bacteriocin export ABC transporter peptidase/permease/ATPase subunit [Bryobacteraceae bacterium]|jgi:ATP-binding cassette subfamily C protein